MARASSRMVTQTVGAARPLLINPQLGRLPNGWEMRYTTDNVPYFVNHINRTYVDPAIVATRSWGSRPLIRSLMVGRGAQNTMERPAAGSATSAATAAAGTAAAAVGQHHTHRSRARRVGRPTRPASAPVRRGGRSAGAAVPTVRCSVLHRA